MVKILDSVLWAIATVFIVYCGLYFTLKLKFVQFRFGSMFRNLFPKQKSDGISPFQSLMIVLGGRIGVGSIAGVALAIHLGGIGSIFWLLLSGLISAPNTFAETVLGVRYKEKDENHIYKGGPSYYLKNGLKKPGLGKLYAVIMLFSYIGGCLSIQANTITTSLTPYISLPNWIFGIILCILTMIIIFGGIEKISKVSSYLVPIMTLIYLGSALWIIITHLSSLPLVFSSIIKSAFNIKAFGFGVLGTMIIGIQRGIFSSEAGLGTGAIAASTVDVDFPARQGFVQMLGIYVTTFLICTATAIAILTSSVNVGGANVNGIEITQEAFIYHFGMFGNIIVIVSIILFAFSTVLSGYYDGESNLKYLCPHDNQKKIFVLKIVSAVILLIGSIMSATLIWQFVNIFTALLAILNIYALWNLRREVIFELKRYKKCGKIK